jgi:UDP-N-acetylmuramate--alanine ligase
MTRTLPTSASPAAAPSVSKSFQPVEVFAPAAPQAPEPLRGRRLHFVGIGGCGMSGLARLAAARGALCTGTDRSESETLDMLREAGIEVSLDQSGEAVPEACDVVVASAAIPQDHPEIARARLGGAEVVKYAQMLGRLMRGTTGVAVSGTHGKSSTTSMLGHILIHAGLDPSVIVGAHCAQIGGGFRCSDKSLDPRRTDEEILVAEACEFDRSFHHLHPTHAVILNVEEDHLDVYANLDAIVESFNVFARRLPEDGLLLVNHEMPHRLAVTAGVTCTVETLGFNPQADWRVEVSWDRARVADGRPLVTLCRQGEAVASWRSPLPGEHMAYNACAAAVLAHRVGASWRAIEQAIESFAGLDRRMQRLGELRLTAWPEGSAPAVVVDDYGHHPTEVDTTLRALRRHYAPRRLVCVFQPHQHSRTRFLMEQFAVSFSEADVAIVPHIYFVRDSEAERQAVGAKDLVDRLRQRGVTAMHLYPFEAIVEQLQNILRPGDLLVTMGAGDVWKIARDVLRVR